MGWKAQSYISSREQPLPGTRLRTATPNFLPVAAADRLFHLQFLLFRWMEITAINIDGPVYGNDRTEYWQVTIQARVNCIEISDWKPDVLQSWRWSGSGGLQSMQGRWDDEKSFSEPPQLWLIQHCLETDAHLLYFFTEKPKNQRRPELHWNRVGSYRTGFAGGCRAPRRGGLCWRGDGFAYSEEAGNGGFHIAGDLVARCGDLTPRLAAEKGEGLCPWPWRVSPKSCLQILAVSKKHFKWNVQKYRLLST